MLQTKNMHPIFSLVSISSFFSLLCLSSCQNFSAIFGIGDIGTDTGNNNFLPTFFRSNFRPYGRDFPNKTPTGRFNNGRILFDFICASFGLKNGFMPPYLNATVTTDQELLTGTNFACGGSGLDPETPRTFNVLSFTDQINLFEEALRRIKRLVGEERTRYIVANALFVVTGGTADTFLYYHSPIRQLRFGFNISRYQDFLLRQLDGYLQRLYNMGARNFFVSNLPPLGCIPIQITLAGRIRKQNRTCLRRQNEDTAVFNRKFQVLLSRLEQLLPNSTLVTLEIFTSFLDIVNNPSKYGFEVTLIGCCGSGLYEIGPLCREPFVRTCGDPTKYVYWDSLDPSNKTYSILATLGVQALRSRFS